MCELDQQTNQPTRGRIKHLARLTKLMIAPSYITIVNFSFLFSIDMEALDQHLEHLRNFFNELDKNEDGFLEPDELVPDN